jgi:hypothetical protein
MTRAIAWQLQPDGFVTGASVHDEMLVKVCFEEGTFRVRIAGTTGALSEFVFGGVTKFRANFIDWPIVDSVFAWKIGQTPEFSPLAEDNPWRLLAWPAPDDDLPGFVAKLSRDNPDSFLVQISCSYGGDAALICTDIELFDVT